RHRLFVRSLVDESAKFDRWLIKPPSRSKLYNRPRCHSVPRSQRRQRTARLRPTPPTSKSYVNAVLLHNCISPKFYKTTIDSHSPERSCWLNEMCHCYQRAGRSAMPSLRLHDVDFSD